MHLKFILSIWMILFIFFISFLIESCIFNKNDNISRIKISYKMPIEILKDKVIGDTINFYITYFSRFSLYELPYFESLQNDNKLKYFSTKFEYFLFDSEKDQGFFLRDLNDSLVNNVSKDRLLKERAYNGGDGDVLNIIDQEIKSIKQVYNTKDRQTFRLISTDTKIADSMYLIFDRSMKNIKFSWSKKMDSMYNSKLCQFIIFLKHDLVKNKDFLKEEFYTTRFEISYEKIQNKIAIKNLFSRLNKISSHHQRLGNAKLSTSLIE